MVLRFPLIATWKMEFTRKFVASEAVTKMAQKPCNIFQKPVLKFNSAYYMFNRKWLEFLFTDKGRQVGFLRGAATKGADVSGPQTRASSRWRRRCSRKWLCIKTCFRGNSHLNTHSHQLGQLIQNTSEWLKKKQKHIYSHTKSMRHAVFIPPHRRCDLFQKVGHPRKKGSMCT